MSSGAREEKSGRTRKKGIKSTILDTKAAVLQFDFRYNTVVRNNTHSKQKEETQ